MSLKGGKSFVMGGGGILNVFILLLPCLHSVSSTQKIVIESSTFQNSLEHNSLTTFNIIPAGINIQNA